MERPKPSPKHYSHQSVDLHATQLQNEGRLPGDRGEGQPFQPNPAEQQAAERLGKPPPLAIPANPDNQESSREVPPPSGTPPEKPSRKSLYRGLAWIAVGGAAIGLSKVTGDQTFYDVGLTITSLGVFETAYGLLYRKK